MNNTLVLYNLQIIQQKNVTASTTHKHKAEFRRNTAMPPFSRRENVRIQLRCSFNILSFR